MPLGKEVGLGPGHIVLDGDPVGTPTAVPPHFRPMPIVAKRSTISATAELLLQTVAQNGLKFHRITTMSLVSTFFRTVYNILYVLQKYVQIKVDRFNFCNIFVKF